MKKYTPLLILAALVFMPGSANAGLSEACFPAVECNGTDDYYGGSCQPHIETVAADCGVPAPGKTRAFSCSNGCYDRSVPVPNTCPGGIEIAGTCYTLLDVIDHAGDYSIWDGTSATDIVHVSAVCADGESAVADAASSTGWKCLATSSGLWSLNGSDVYYNGGEVGVGTNTPSSGLDVVVASGGALEAGSGVSASGDYAVALGRSSSASGNESLAAGFNSQSSGNNSVAIGYQSVANDQWSVAIGKDVLSENGSTAIGSGAQALGGSSVAIGGGQTTAAGTSATAMGTGTTATAFAATAMGSGSTAGGQASTAMGSNTTASNNYATAMGASTTASGVYSTAMGLSTTASNGYSTAMGRDTVASGAYSTAIGNATNATGDYSTSMGLGTTAQAYDSVVIGRYNVLGGNVNTWLTTDPLFVIGNGASAGVRSNAVTVLKDARTGIGTSTPGAGLDVEVTSGAAIEGGNSGTDASGNNSIAVGNSVTASGDSSAAFGWSNTASGNYSTSTGAQNTASGIYSFASGNNSDATGVASFASGLNVNATKNYAVAMGANSTASGTNSFAAGETSVASGDSSLALGYSNDATGPGSTALGYNTTSTGFGSFTAGRDNTATQPGAIAMGYSSDAIGQYSTAIGLNATAGGANSFATGLNTQANGLGSFVAGGNNVVSNTYGAAFGSDNNVTGFGSFTAGALNNNTAGSYATSFGYNNTTSANYAMTFGRDNSALGESSTAIGGFVTSEAYRSTVIGSANILNGAYNKTSWVATDPIFVIGNGQTTGARSNAMTVLKNGNVGVGTVTPSYKLHASDATVAGYFDNTTTSTYASLANPDVAVRAAANSTGLDVRGSYASASNSNGIAYGVYADAVSTSGQSYGVYGRGDDAGGFFQDSTNTGTAYLGSGNTGVTGLGSSYGAYFYDTNNTGNAYLGYGDYAIYGTGNAYLSGNISVAPNTNTSSTIGRTNIGYCSSYSDFACISHYDRNSAGNYALLQNSAGSTYLNASTGQKINFRINNVDRMNLDSNGNLGIGDSTPETRLDVHGNDNDGVTATLKVTNGSQSILMDGNEIDSFGGSNTLYLNNNSNGAVRIGSGQVLVTSDKRLKKDISDLEYGLSDLLNTRPVSYNWKKHETDQKQLGFIAQEIQEILPELVAADYENDEEQLYLDYNGMIPVLTAAIQELSAKNDALQEVVCELKPEAELCTK